MQLIRISALLAIAMLASSAVFAISLNSLAASSNQNAADMDSASGLYSGTVEGKRFAKGPLSLDLSVTDGKVSGFVRFPDENASITEGTLTRDGRIRLKYSHTIARGEINGEIRGGMLRGDFSLGPVTGTVRLTKVATGSMASSQARTAPAPATKTTTAAAQYSTDTSNKYDFSGHYKGWVSTTNTPPGFMTNARDLDISVDLKVDSVHFTGSVSSRDGTFPITKSAYQRLGSDLYEKVLIIFNSRIGSIQYAFEGQYNPNTSTLEGQLTEFRENDIGTASAGSFAIARNLPKGYALLPPTHDGSGSASPSGKYSGRAALYNDAPGSNRIVAEFPFSFSLSVTDHNVAGTVTTDEGDSPILNGIYSDPILKFSFKLHGIEYIFDGQYGAYNGRIISAALRAPVEGYKTWRLAGAVDVEKFIEVGSDSALASSGAVTGKPVQSQQRAALGTAQDPVSGTYKGQFQLDCLGNKFDSFARIEMKLAAGTLTGKMILPGSAFVSDPGANQEPFQGKYNNGEVIIYFGHSGQTASGSLRGRITNGTLLGELSLGDCKTSVRFVKETGPWASSSKDLLGSWEADMKAQDAQWFSFAIVFTSVEDGSVSGKALQTIQFSGSFPSREELEIRGLSFSGSFANNELSLTIQTDHGPLNLKGSLHEDGSLSGGFLWTTPPMHLSDGTPVRTEPFRGTWSGTKKKESIPSEQRLKKSGGSTPAPPTRNSPVRAGGDVITGTWGGSVDAGGMTVSFTLTLKLDGDKVTGTSTSDQGSVAISNGKWDGHKLSFSLDTPQGSITMTGAVNAGQIIGDFDFAGQMQGKWTAKKK